MKQKKKDYLIYTLAFQFIVCALLFGAFYGLKRINSDIYLTVKSDYYDELNENFPFLDTIKKEQINEDINNNKTPTTEPVKESKPKINTSKATGDYTTEAPTKVEETELSAQIKAEGGQDYSITDIDEVPSNVSVNSYTLNQSMVLPVSGEISSGFGVRNHPITGELSFHAGVDIASDSGTPIYSAFSGKVIVADYDEWNGYYLKIQHDGDIMTVYCHCNSLNVKEGDKVDAGDIIGTVGSTGSSTGPHLHFELRIDNVSYDPQTALSEAISAV